MLLKKIEIKGFKSFGDKITIHFGEGITGIVGPNGSGKSNVVDAIRWVLGEQSSKALRSDKMENVIFNGTAKRKALQMAEVLMTFQNNRNLISTEFSEVTIGRRYYRAGEGEYLLNGVACRLKDIHNLFMDTGIGHDSYAIIELKMVDEILNDKDGSRRELFEEAAGIAKFRIRRKETLRKLEETDADIARVDDLLAEILKNMRQLDRQAKQARQYLELKEQYKKFSLALAKKVIEVRSLLLKDFEALLHQENDKRTELDAQIADLTAQIEAQKFQLLGQEKQINELQKTYTQTLDQIRKKENEINLKNEKFKSLNTRKTTLSEQIIQNRQKADALKDNLQTLEAEKNDLSEVTETQDQQLRQLQHQYDRIKHEAETHKKAAAELQTRLKNKQHELALTIKKNDDCQLQVQIFSANLSGFEQEKQQAQTQLDQLSEQLSSVAEQIEAFAQQQEEFLRLQEQAKRKIDSVQSLLTELNRQRANTLGDYEAKKKELAVTTALSQNLDAYSQSIKYLKSQTQYQSLVFLSDILDCDPQYRAAVEAFLADKMEFLLTESESHALQAIAELSQKQKGRAHFVFEPTENPATPTQLPQGVLPLAAVLKVEPKYQAAVQALCDGVYIVEPQTEISNLEGVFVDKNGQWIKNSNHLSGGQINDNKAKKIGRYFDLQHLKNQVEDLQDRLEGIEQQIDEQTGWLQAAQKESYVQHLAEVEKRINALERQHLTLSTQKDQLGIYLSNSQDKNKQILDKIAAFQAQSAELKPKIEALQSEIEALEDQLEQTANQAEETNRLHSQLGIELNEHKIQFNKYSDRLNSLERELNYKSKDHQNLLQALQKAQESLEQTTTELEQIAKDSDAENADLPELYSHKNQLENDIKNFEKQYFEEKNEVIETEKLVSQYRHQREQSQQKATELSEKTNATKIELLGIKDRMSVEFEIELTDELLAQADEGDYTEADLRGQVAAIKLSLDKFGPINFTAIEAYNEIKERHDFILSQKNDLLKAKDTLVATISEIETVAKENFLNTFSQIRANFVEIFRSLFAQEDTCDLVLAQPDDPLGSDIDIIAKPKGKKPLTINQLSGGEKTLTATALLFAIYLIKPAPFCVFDEVDAPLDDANIDKFNNIIRKFSDRSQFIIVTHNKRTMACTDVMYGITMIDQVSTVVPVDLRVMEQVGG